MNHRILHDIIMETARAEKLHAKDYPDGTSADLTPLAQQFRMLAEAKEDVGTVTWADVLGEETAEAISETAPARLRAELVQVASVAVRWIASLDRREGPSPAPAPAPFTRPDGPGPSCPP